MRAAALAVVGDLATIPPSLAHRRHRARRAVAVAAACLVAAGAAAAYAVTSTSGTAAVDPAAVTDSTAAPDPERTLDPAEPGGVDPVCDPVLMWLAPDASLTDTQAALRLLHVYQQLTQLARDSQAAEQAQAMLAAIDAGDRGTVEDFASGNCPD